MEAQNSLPAANFLDPTKRIKVRVLPATAPSSSRNIEIDVCLSRDGSKVRRVNSVTVFPIDQNEGAMKYLYKDTWIVKGLEEALFQDYSKLEILVISSELDENAYETDVLIWAHIKGWVDGNKTYVSAAAVGKYEGANIQAPTVLEYRTAPILGDLVQGSLLTNGKCKSYETRSGTSLFRLGTAKFYLEFCDYDSMDDSEPKRVVRAIVADDNPALGAPIKVDLTGEELERRLRVANGHHAHIFGFRLNLDEVSYAATERGADGGYFGGVDFLPEFPGPKNAPFGPPVYRIKYAGGDWGQEKKTQLDRRILWFNPGIATATRPAVVYQDKNSSATGRDESCSATAGIAIPYDERRVASSSEVPSGLNGNTFITVQGHLPCPGLAKGELLINSADFSVVDYTIETFPLPAAPVNSPGCTFTTVKYAGGDGANIRAEKDTESEIVETLFFGDTVEYCGTEGRWKKVKLLSGQDGWMSGTLLN
jgi:hypothetical protein